MTTPAPASPSPAPATNGGAGALGPEPSSSSTTATASASGPQRPGAGKKWSEVCERVQQPDGSVRTSPPFKSAATSATTSPPRARYPGGGSLGSLRPNGGRGGLGGIHALSSIPVKAPSRGGSSRGGSSGKSSRSSSRDIARDGDISSRCSSGCWETSTNSSEPSRPRTPIDATPSPSESKGLLMPDPIRTGLIIPPALLADEPRAETSETVCPAEEVPPPVCVDTTPLTVGEGARPGMPLKWDPFGRDGSRRSDVKGEWSPEPLAKYLKIVAMQIDANLREGHLPTVERLDAFVSRLVSNSQRQFKHAPRKVRHQLQAMFALRFQKFWNFTRNEKVGAITAEELKFILTGLVENLSNSDFTHSEQLAQPKPLRHYSYGQFIRPAADFQQPTTSVSS